MTIQEIIDELQSIEYQLDSGHITDAQSDLNLLKDNLERLDSPFEKDGGFSTDDDGDDRGELEDKSFGGDTGIDADYSVGIEISGC
jgi:hypothetical protein